MPEGNVALASVDRNFSPKSRETKHVTTSFGEIAYTEEGNGPPAIFIHGIFLNGYLWRDVASRLSSIRRCIAVDLLGHGATRTAAGQDLSFETQTEMIAAFADALGLDCFDLIGNDSGGGIAQIFATRYENRLRSLILTNCDTHDNCPPAALQPLIAAAGAGQLKALGHKMLADVNFARQALGIGYQFPMLLTEETVGTYLMPIFGDEERADTFEKLFIQCFLSADCHQTFVLERIKMVQTPTLVVWGTADPFFDVKWGHWLYQTIPGARSLVLLEGAKLFFPEERPDDFATAIRNHWDSLEVEDSSR